MTLDEIKVVGIAGAGTMGASMAQIFAQYGYTVIIYDAFEAGLERGKHLVEINQASLVEAGDITAEQSAEIKTKLSFTGDINGLKDCDIIVESVLERLDVKQDFWVKAEKLLYTAYIAMIFTLSPESERNFETLIDMINLSECREEDETFKNAVDVQFECVEAWLNGDTLPAQVRLNTVVTGTYNFPGTYKITYRVNGGEYRTLADNLSTAQNYTLAASPTALGLAANERVTEIMFVFGQAPAGFAQVETPYLYCTAVGSLPSGSFTNVADAGGVYNGQWVQAVSRWVTTVYGKPEPLPRTGY